MKKEGICLHCGKPFLRKKTERFCDKCLPWIDQENSIINECLEVNREK